MGFEEKDGMGLDPPGEPTQGESAGAGSPDIAVLRSERNGALKVLLSAAARGDIAAFEALYDSTGPWLASQVRRVVGGLHAEDVLAEVFLQVWRSLSSYDAARGQPLAWLATIARSRALDKLRTERRSHGGERDAPHHQESEETNRVGPEQLFAASQRAIHIQACVDQLSSKEQLVLRMAYVGDLTQAEIAAVTGLPLGSVKTLMTRSQQKLSRLLQ